MKSRTSFCNRTAFRKDVTRFAPAWGLYSVGLLLMFTVLMAENTGYYRANSLVNVIAFMAIINFCYGILNAQLLFGDLCSSRMCNALHALPLRRETWFGTHLAAGLAFSLIPNLAFAILCMASMNLGVAWSVPLWCLLASTLQYICFFGIGVLCMMLTGNRFAGGLVYGLVNFFSMLVYWLVDSLYEPLLAGIQVRQDPFLFASPVVKLAGEPQLVEILRERVVDLYGNFDHWKITGISIGEGWDWAAAYAVVGILALAAALVLYRRRDLERAGDFMAFSAGEPVLLIVYTLTVGGLFHLMSEAFSGGIEKYFFLAMGLAVGFFTGLMLLQRTTRVFRKKTVGAFFLFAAVFTGSLLLTWLDPLGLTRWVPDADEVASVNLSNRYVPYSYSDGELNLTEAEDIQAIIDAHEYQIGRTGNDEIQDFGIYADVSVCLEYTLKNGTVRTRFYGVNTFGRSGEILKPYFSSFRYVTGFEESQIPELAGRVFQIGSGEKYISDRMLDEAMMDIEDVDVEGLLQAIAADCAAGNMAQRSQYHLVPNEDGYLDWDWNTYVEIAYSLDQANGGTHEYLHLTIYKECVHTLRWLEENGLFDPNNPENYKYGG